MKHYFIQALDLGIVAIAMVDVIQHLPLGNACSTSCINVQTFICKPTHAKCKMGRTKATTIGNHSKQPGSATSIESIAALRQVQTAITHCIVTRKNLSNQFGFMPCLKIRLH
ncbi:MAG: hypothetical protein ABIR84_08385 [Candidatus Nitrotoga sp.]